MTTINEDIEHCIKIVDDIIAKAMNVKPDEKNTDWINLFYIAGELASEADKEITKYLYNEGYTRESTYLFVKGADSINVREMIYKNITHTYLFGGN